MKGFKNACLAGAMALVLTVPVQAGHNENVQVVRIAQVLAQQASWIHHEAHRLTAGGWGSSWQDQQAQRELHQFATLTNQLYQRAVQLEPGNGGGWGGNPGGGHPHVHALDHRGHNDQQIGWQLQQLFRQVWQNADRAEAHLYQSQRLYQLRGYWDYQVCGTLRQLRQAMGGLGGGYPYAREGRRANLFDRLLSRF